MNAPAGLLTIDQEIVQGQNNSAPVPYLGLLPRKRIKVTTLTSGSFDAELVAGLPRTLVDAYIDFAVRHAAVARVDDQQFAEVAGLAGVWGSGHDSAAALDDLRKSLFDWIVIKLERGAEIPALEGFDLNRTPSSEQAS